MVHPGWRLNGAGKSTFTQSSETLASLINQAKLEIEVINPDLVTLERLQAEPSLGLSAANVWAANEAEQRLRELLAHGTASVAIETVLSTDKYKPIYALAESKGYRIIFIYVVLGRMEDAIGRVRIRVSKGGHNVPVDKIRKRWSLSLANLPWYWEHAHHAFVFFNGGTTPVLIAERGGARGDVFNATSLQHLLQLRA